MDRFAWPQLMRLGLTEMGLAPSVFWNLTPVELMMLSGSNPVEMISRKQFEKLLERFPDDKHRIQQELD
jgi:uncharacterized phage protein (TIGR02216 family)